MPAIPGVTTELMTDLLAFLSNPEEAPPGSALPLGGFGGGRSEPDYPEGVSAPPSRYKTGYGTEPYVIAPPWRLLPQA